jgi:hypothetical protein
MGQRLPRFNCDFGATLAPVACNSAKKAPRSQRFSSAEMSQSLSARGAAAFAAALTMASTPGVALAWQRGEGPSAPPTQNAAPMQGLYTASPGATRYSTPDGQVRFVFDRSGGRAALVRFEGDPEVHVLRPVMAAGGGEIYTTEDANIQLRVTPHGGIIVYTRSMRTGSPVSEDGSAAPLTPAAIAFEQMMARMRMLQEQARRHVGQTVTFTIQTRQQLSPPQAGVMVDAAERAAEGLAAAPMTTIRRVLIVIGPTPRAVMQGDLLIIQVAPQMGYAGRPSSTAIRNVVTGTVQGPEQ